MIRTQTFERVLLALADAEDEGTRSGLSREAQALLARRIEEALALFRER